MIIIGAFIMGVGVGIAVTLIVGAFYAAGHADEILKTFKETT